MGDDERVAALSARIKELEQENARLNQQLQAALKTDRRRTKGNAARQNQKKRFVALKIMYVGSKYHGFASQGCKAITVESELFAAFERSRLLTGSIAEAKYSRCGRTDKGVSATCQVVALYLRSIVQAEQQLDIDEAVDRLEAAKDSRQLEEIYSAQGTEEVEIDYVNILNRALPDDIRVLGWSPVPPGFHARFSCLYREYKYFFFSNGLDVNAMKEASQKFVGEHDFRNLCKMDAENVHNYRRRILAFDIYPMKEAPCAGLRKRELWVMHVVGHAFLWHQVRCMAAVLFMVGQSLEQPTIVEDLLDVTKFPRKPQYVMAPETPLVLRKCGFEGLNFRCRPEARKFIQRHLEKLLQRSLMDAALITEAMLGLEYDDGLSQPLKSVHVPLMCRSTEPTYEERRLKLAPSDDGVRS